MKERYNNSGESHRVGELNSASVVLCVEFEAYPEAKILSPIELAESEIKQNEIKTENLIARLSELPKEVSAEPIYAQLKLLGEKTTILKDSRVQLESQTHRITAQGIDKEGLRDRISNAVNLLECSPVEKQRTIFNNVIDFAELHPSKVRLGVYAPLAALASSRTVLNGGGGET